MYEQHACCKGHERNEHGRDAGGKNVADKRAYQGDYADGCADVHYREGCLCARIKLAPHNPKDCICNADNCRKREGDKVGREGEREQSKGGGGNNGYGGGGPMEPLDVAKVALSAHAKRDNDKSNGSSNKGDKPRLRNAVVKKLDAYEGVVQEP